MDTCHIVDDEELVELVLVAYIQHLDSGGVRVRVSRRILHIVTISAEEGNTLHGVVRIGVSAIRQEGCDGIGGEDERSAVVDHIGRSKTLDGIAEEADILIVVVMGRHEEVNSGLEVGSRRLPGKAIVFESLLRGSHPDSVHLVSVEIQLDILVFIHAHVYIHVLHPQFRVRRDTVHLPGDSLFTGGTAIGHILVAADRNIGGDGITEVRDGTCGKEVINRRIGLCYSCESSSR